MGRKDFRVSKLRLQVNAIRHTCLRFTQRPLCFLPVIGVKTSVTKCNTIPPIFFFNLVIVLPAAHMYQPQSVHQPLEVNTAVLRTKISIQTIKGAMKLLSVTKRASITMTMKFYLTSIQACVDMQLVVPFP